MIVSPRGQPISTYDIRPVIQIGMHTTRPNRANCSRPLYKPITLKVSVSSNNTQPAMKGRRDLKYFMRLFYLYGGMSATRFGRLGWLGSPEKTSHDLQLA